MTLHRKSFRLFAYAALLAFGAGCGGINANVPVSPAMFLLKANPPPAGQSESANLVAYTVVQTG